jgi:hypothetical protein
MSQVFHKDHRLDQQQLRQRCQYLNSNRQCLEQEHLRLRLRLHQGNQTLA